MVKTLENNLGNKVKNNGLKRLKIGALALLASASLSFVGCKPHVDPTPDPITLENVNVTQGENKTIDLTQISDNSEATWTGIADYNHSLFTPTLVGKNLTIQVSDDIREDTPYSVSLKVKNGDKEETAVLEGVVKNVFEVRGVLQDNETHTNQAGILKIFDSSNDNVGEVSTSDGNFLIKPTELASGSKVKLQAKLNDSYVRTMEFNVDNTKDISVLVRAVPKVNFDINDSGVVDATDNQNFIDFIKQINTSFSYEDGTWFSKIKKWNLDNLLSIEICRTNSDNGTFFSQTAINNLITYLTEEDNIKKFIAGKKDLSSIVQVLDNSSLSHKAQSGYITVLPNDGIGTKGGTGLHEGFYQDSTNSRIITSSIIHLIPTELLLASNHEFGHSFIAQVLWDESEHIISPTKTIMYSGTARPLKPGLADEKAGKLLYEETYSAGEKLENILGINFLDNSN
jgi:hypothetical protein